MNLPKVISVLGTLIYFCNVISCMLYRSNQVFKLNDDRIKQFEHCRFRGYYNEDKTSKNPFTDKEFAVAVKEYAARNSARRERQKERKLKREEKLSKKKEGRKKRAKKAQKKSGRKKRRGRPGPEVQLGENAKRIKRLFKNESQKGQRALGKENIDPQVNQVAVPSRPERVNCVQKNTFLDRRLNTEAFLTSLQENA